MIQAICADCNHVFMACVVLGLTACPKCGSQKTHVAIPAKGERP